MGGTSICSLSGVGYFHIWLVWGTGLLLCMFSLGEGGLLQYMVSLGDGGYFHIWLIWGGVLSYMVRNEGVGTLIYV